MADVRKGRRRSFWDYKPVKNSLAPDSSFDGCLIETYGAEYELVRKQCKKDTTKLWTIIDGEGRDLYAVAGFHFVNRLGYIITERSWERDDIEYRV